MITTGYEYNTPVIVASNGQTMRDFLPKPVVTMPIGAVLGIHWSPECQLRGLIRAALDAVGDTREFNYNVKEGNVFIYAFEGTRNEADEYPDGDERDDEAADWWQEEWERAMCD